MLQQPLEIPEPDHYEPKEVYAFFGLAAYWAQVLEQGVVNLIVGLRVAGETVLTPKHVLDAYADEDRKTLGQLLNSLRSETTVSIDVEECLKRALQLRNHLTHQFFVEHDEAFLSDVGRRRMIDELRSITASFRDADKLVDPLWLGVWKRHGITQQLIERELESLQNRIESDRS
ncbi:MAG: hypothetical protein JXB13_05135 [Phycisphaerae bacterium]|nr:hypothetical protein [Phycisphaerae bacterium]